MSGHDYPDDGPSPSLWRRLLHGSNDLPVGERFRAAVLKPADSSAPVQPDPQARTVEELQAAESYADDKERFLGLLAAPLAAAIGFFIANYLVEHNPPALLKNGQVNPLHGSVSTYHTLELVLIGLAVVMLGTAWYRKRMFLGISMALYGLGVFNLHYWGFGIPFLFGGAWLLVRSYRAHQAVRNAQGPNGSRGGAGSGLSRPKANKRYTPPI
jgi:hypothetical protein